MYLEKYKQGVHFPFSLCIRSPFVTFLLFLLKKIRMEASPPYHLSYDTFPPFLPNAVLELRTHTVNSGSHCYQFVLFVNFKPHMWAFRLFYIYFFLLVLSLLLASYLDAHLQHNMVIHFPSVHILPKTSVFLRGSQHSW